MNGRLRAPSWKVAQMAVVQWQRCVGWRLQAKLNAGAIIDFAE